MLFTKEVRLQLRSLENLNIKVHNFFYWISQQDVEADGWLGTNCLSAFWRHEMNWTESLLTRLSCIGADVFEPASRPKGDSLCTKFDSFQSKLFRVRIFNLRFVSYVMIE